MKTLNWNNSGRNQMQKESKWKETFTGLLLVFWSWMSMGSDIVIHHMSSYHNSLYPSRKEIGGFLLHGCYLIVLVLVKEATKQIEFASITTDGWAGVVVGAQLKMLRVTFENKNFKATYKSQDPLEFWKLNTSLNGLHQFARLQLGTMSSSTPIERGFKTSSRFSTFDRPNLSPSSIEMCTFVAANYHFIEKFSIGELLDKILEMKKSNPMVFDDLKELGDEDDDEVDEIDEVVEGEDVIL